MTPSDPQQLWAAVDEYIADKVVPLDAALASALADSDVAGLPHINVAANQGKLLHILARSAGATSVLEVGTLGGFSTIWLARALPPGGRVVTLEVSQKHAAVARANLERAGVGGVVDIRVGPALQTLPALADEGAGPFDFVFIDADKANIPAYYDWGVQLSQPGGVIVVDNVVRRGALIDERAAGTDADVAGVRALLDTMASDDRVTATVVQTVGSKGHDGFAIAIVNG